MTINKLFLYRNDLTEAILVSIIKIIVDEYKYYLGNIIAFRMINSNRVFLNYTIGNYWRNIITTII